MDQLIVTVGPNSISKSVLASLGIAGATSYRINLSHSDEQSLGNYFETIVECGIIPSIDTQGAQLRVEEFSDPSRYMTGQHINLIFGKLADCNNPGTGSADSCRYIRFNHPEVSGQVMVGDVLKIDFDGLLVCLSKQLSENVWRGQVIAEGSVILNRAVDIKGKTIDLKPLTEFDLKAIKYAEDRGCKEVYASFISSGEDAKFVRSCISPSTRLISKIETAKGVANAIEIIDDSDAILIDRGDLSREISIASVPMAVQSLVRLAVSKSCPVYVATNVLDSMMTSKLPSRAEVSDIYTLLASGVSGLVLAAEVAIGGNPVASTALIKYLSRIYQNHRDGLHGISAVEKPSPELIGDQLYSWL